jgi:hypothetical protein
MIQHTQNDDDSQTEFTNSIRWLSFTVGTTTWRHTTHPINRQDFNTPEQTQSTRVDLKK